MIWCRVVIVSLLIALVTSCVTEQKDIKFKWDQKKDKEEVELLARYMEAYPLVFKENSKLELQQLFVKRTTLLESYNEGVYTASDFHQYWELRKYYFKVYFSPDIPVRLKTQLCCFDQNSLHNFNSRASWCKARFLLNQN